MKFTNTIIFIAGLASLAMAAPTAIPASSDIAATNSAAVADKNIPPPTGEVPTAQVAKIVPRFTWDHSRRFTLRLSVSATLVRNGREVHISETVVLTVYRARDLHCYNRREAETLPAEADAEVEKRGEQASQTSIRLEEFEEISIDGCHYQIAESVSVVVRSRS